jgi:ADP-ribose pyrophosphatase
MMLDIGGSRQTGEQNEDTEKESKHPIILIGSGSDVDRESGIKCQLLDKGQKKTYARCMDESLKEKTLKSELVFNGKFLHVWRDDVELPDGRHSFREFIKHPGAACVVPVLENGNLLMVRQFRYSVGEVFLEFPAGKSNRGEETAITAVRELEEETGYLASTVKLLTKIHPVIGYSNERIDIYLATGLTPTKINRDHDELMELAEVPPEELRELIWSGEITDVKTQIAAFWFFRNQRS